MERESERISYLVYGTIEQLFPTNFHFIISYKHKMAVKLKALMN